MPRPPHERFSRRPFPEEEPTHTDLMEGIELINSKLVKIEEMLRK